MLIRFSSWGSASVVLLCVLGVADTQRLHAADDEIRDAFNLLQSRPVQTELEMAPLQLEELQRIHTDRSRLIITIRPRLEQAEEAQKPTVIADFKASMKSLDNEALKILLPRQQMRLSQLAWQKLVKINDARAGLHHERVIAELEIDDTQNKAIAEKTTEVHARVQKRVEELTKELEEVKEAGRREVLALLTPEQREKYEKLFGPPFDFKPSP